MSVTIGDVLRVVAILNWVDGDIMQNVFTTVVSGTGGPYDDDDVVDDMEDWALDVYSGSLGRLTTEVSGSEVRVYIYDAVDDDWDEIGSKALTLTGTDAADVLPRGVALLVNCKTLDPDVNGKKYFGGTTEASQTDGLWTAAALASFATIASNWVTPFTGTASSADFTPGVWSPTKTDFEPMTGTVIIPTIPAYQRRRKQGIGI